ncbi:ABC transporter ATP-binding protein [Amycolatopsis sp. AA4]|uniref:ABC transporter ATP-binding protein n=1 Tax=Actinomycetes TaxID=1760 RepID=UPI0001B54B2B|nr:MULTISPECIES: ABC transporter ATP-binding protein [Actinomycetes]ATY13020.1 ABC transporter ATP-binding protein [Amycolatopsis sp. AA4]EFL08891.1 lipid A export permease/ATP-binding protein MsbA [Streptomyces sp. AA4]
MSTVDGRPVRPLRALLGHAEPHRWPLVLVLVLTLAGSAAELVQPLMVETIIAKLSLGESLREELLLLVGVFVVSVALNGWHTWIGQRTAERMVFGIRRGLIRRLIRLRVSELDQREPGTLTTRVTSDSTVVQHAATTGLIDVVNGVLHLVASLVMMALMSLPLLGMTAGVLAVVGVVLGFVMPRIRQVVLTTQESVGEIGAALDRSLGAARTVKASGAEAEETERAVSAARTAYRAGLKGARYQVVIATVSGMAVQTSFLVVIGFGGVLVATGGLSVATLIAFLLYLFNLGTPILSLVTGFAALQQGLGALERIEEVREMTVEDDVDTEVSAPAGPPPRVVVDHVSFAYPGRPPALSDVSFSAEPGEMTAIVGPSGAGKTTLFSLLQRFYDHQDGRILLAGDDIARRSRAEVRRRIAYVEQDSPMLAGTFRENLVYAAPEAAEEAIAEVLGLTGLDELVQRLPEKLDTPVGVRGIALSGGERQRLAIARALLRRPQVLLLDEATAHLDARSEQALRRTIEAAARECTVLLIAHRLSTVVSAHRLVLLDRGGVRSIGTHAELLAADPMYRELAATQLLVPEADQEKDPACPSPHPASSTTPSTTN